jgi:hypothetical protein
MITSLARGVAIALLVLIAAATMLILTAWTTLPLDRVTVAIDGETHSLADLQGGHAAAFLAAAVALLVVAPIATGLAIGVGLAFAALGIATGLAAAAAALALAASPLLLLGWLLWRLLRSRPAPAVPAIARP